MMKRKEWLPENFNGKSAARNIPQTFWKRVQIDSACQSQSSRTPLQTSATESFNYIWRSNMTVLIQAKKNFPLIQKQLTEFYLILLTHDS